MEKKAIEIFFKKEKGFFSATYAIGYRKKTTKTGCRRFNGIRRPRES